MPPLVGIAISMLPGLAKRVADNVLPDVEDRITRTVRDVLGTDDPKQVESMLADPQVASELRLRLAQIEADADVRQAEIEQRKREAEIEKLKVDLDTFREQLKDTQSARTMMTELSAQGSPLRWGPVAVSLIVDHRLLPCACPSILRRPERPAERRDVALLQMLNIVIGALTAGFATVISYWLGSSQGSRDKDEVSMRTQDLVATMQQRNVQSTERLVQEQARQTTAIIEKVTTAPAPAPAAPAAPGAAQKDARQFGHCLDIVLRHEGGFVDHPQDPGGATNLGITLKTLSAWRKAQCTADDVRNLTREEAQEIYRANYWNALNCDSLPPGVDLVAFDFGVNAGVGRAARLLQEVVHVEQDGEVGAITVGAVQRINDPAFIIQKFTEGRMKHYKSLSKMWPTFGRGWTRRTDETASAALSMT